MVASLSRTFAVAILVLVGGCSGSKLAATPNLFLVSDADPFAGVAAEHRTSRAEILYVTDRKPIETTDGTVAYGYERSPSIAVGTCAMTIGGDLPWETIVEESRSRSRRSALPIAVTDVTELVRGPGSPVFIERDGEMITDPVIEAAREDARRAVAAIVDERVARAERKEIFLFVHGYNNTFEDAALRMGQLWHFLGRAGVPIVYTWPAGHPGMLRGYNYDRESGEYTVFHLRGALKFLASTPGVEKIHIVAHSRGTDVAISALRELHIECRGAGLNTRETYKIGNVILAAPDLDFEVVQQRIAAERLHHVPERMTIYLSEDDKAIGLSTWLFSSLRRLGQLALGDLSDQQKASLAVQDSIDFIHVEAKLDFLGHGYFISNPAVLSDLILVLRDECAPGAEHGRPLEHEGATFWTLRDDYPQFDDDAGP